MKDMYYGMNIAGLDRKLPLCPISDKLMIGAFVIFGDPELTCRCAEELVKRLPEHDVLITAESKGIPLGYEMAKQSGKNYVVARKAVKLYMTDPIAVEVRSITTDFDQTLYLSSEDVARMKGKKVLIADDVISTGESLNALMKLAEKAECNVIAKAAVLAEGDAAYRNDIIFLQELPLFTKEK